MRSLAHDLGQKIGCGAHLRNLRRLISGKFDVANAVQFEDAMGFSHSELTQRVIPFVKLVV